MYQDWISSSNSHHAALDGVPMKVNNCFRPKSTQVEGSISSQTLPQSSSSKALNFKYTFETEDGYLHWYSAFTAEKDNRLKEQATKAAAREKAKTEALHSNASETVTAQSHTKMVVPPPPPPHRPVIAPTGATPSLPFPSSILEPQRASPVPTAKQQLANSEVNIRDFENFGEDPFDTLELKSINDMEELGKVLSNDVSRSNDLSVSTTADSTPPPSTQSQQTAATSDPLYANLEATNQPTETIYSNVTLSSTSSSPEQTVRNEPTSLPFSKRAPVPSPRSSSLMNSPEVTEKEIAGSSVKFEKEGGYVTLSTTSTGKQKPKVAAKPNMPAKQKPKYDTTMTDNLCAKQKEHTGRGVAALSSALENDLSKKLGPPGAPKGFSYLSSGPTPSTTSGDEHNVRNIEWPSLDQSQPGSAASDTAVNPFLVGNRGLANGGAELSAATSTNIPASSPQEKPKSHLKPTRPPPPVDAAKARQGKKKTPANSEEKSGSDAEVAQSLLSMGFDRGQIDAAMRNFGCDTKKIVDHLVAVQSMSSQGIKWQNAQQALFLFGNDTASAGKYAQAYQQLVEFGFPGDRIKAALLENEIDANKALDKLLVAT